MTLLSTTYQCPPYPTAVYIQVEFLCSEMLEMRGFQFLFLFFKHLYNSYGVNIPSVNSEMWHSRSPWEYYLMNIEYRLQILKVWVRDVHHILYLEGSELFFLEHFIIPTCF